MEIWDYEQARRYLMAMDIPARQEEEHRHWVESNTARFLRTLELVPFGERGQRCLEVGAMPFTFTLLLRRLRPYELLLVDYYASGESRGRTEHEVCLPTLGEDHRFESFRCDLERDRLPFADNSVDLALCCEVLEHVTSDPVAMLVEIHRVLLPGAPLIVTTPNVARLENCLRLLHGRNLYDPYELTFGPTWRHNREYTPKEVADLLTEVGFVVEELHVEDALPPGVQQPLSQRVLRRLYESFYGQRYGAQIYVRARRGPEARRFYPHWLFQHIPEIHDGGR